MIEVVVKCKATGIVSSLIFMCIDRFNDLFLNTDTFDNLAILNVITEQDNENIYNDYKQLIK